VTFRPSLVGSIDVLDVVLAVTSSHCVEAVAGGS
jgi:hypothetical protein